MAVNDDLNVLYTCKFGDVAVGNVLTAEVQIVERCNAHGGVTDVDSSKIRILSTAKGDLGADGTRTEITRGETEGLAIKIGIGHGKYLLCCSLYI